MRYRILALVAIALVVTVAAWSQTATSSLRGTITDQSGAVVPKAEVVISNPETGFTRTTTTDAEGNYQFVQVPPAKYAVQVSSPGFTTTKESVQLLVNSPATLHITLAVKATAEQVEVTAAAAPLVNTQDASLGNAFDTRQVGALPFEGRDPAGVLSLQAGVVFAGNNPTIDRDYDTRSGAVLGARSDQTNITLDGVDNNNQYSGFAFEGALRTTLDSLQEFRVTTTGANPEAGRSSGAQVALVTKSGTNKFHGSAYEYHRPTFTANDLFNKQSQLDNGLHNRPPKFIRNTFGASLGGPILKDRAFFFLNYEGQRKRESEQVTRTVPSEALRQGYLSYKNTAGGISTLTPADITALDPLGIGPSPQIMALFNQYPTPNTDSVGDGMNFRGYTFAAPNPAKLDTYIAKLDFNLDQSGNHRAWVRGNLQNDRAAGVPQWVYPDGTTTPANSVTLTNSKGLAAGYTAILGTNWVNNFRYGFIRFGTGTAGVSNGHYVTLRGLDPLVPTGERSTYITFPVHNFANDTTWLHGKHTIQFGANFRMLSNQHRTDANSWFSASTNPSWLLGAHIAGKNRGLDPGDVASSFYNSFDYPMGALVGIIPQVNSVYNRDKTGAALDEGTYVSRNYKSHELEFYTQDSWRARPNLTITAGVRYTLLQPPYEANGVQVQPTTDMNQWFRDRWTNMLNGVSFKDPLTFDLSGQANGKKPYWAWDKLDIAPRFAIAYSPNFESGILNKLFGSNGKSSIRAGYGMYYDHFGEGIINTFSQNGSFGLSTSLTNGGGILTPATAPRFTGLQNLPASLIKAAPPAGFPVTYPDDYAVTWGLDDHLKTPYAHVFSFTVTRELPSNFVFEASYVGRLAKRLLMQEDLAMPLNLVDKKSGMDYFTAAQALTKMAVAGTPIGSVAPIPYWENMFPGAAGVDLISDCAGGIVPGTNYTATQNIYDLFSCYPYNETSAQQYLDQPDSSGLCWPSCSVMGPWAYYTPQFASLYAWRSIGSSYYHGLVLSLRRRMAQGMLFDFNYTFSKSIDSASDAERTNNDTVTNGLGGQIINSWAPAAQQGLSDFDARHQINANWTYELPFGRGKRFAGSSHGVLNALIGGWALSGLVRWANSYPTSAFSGSQWSTNWQLSGPAMLIGKAPSMGDYWNADGTIRAFKDPEAAVAAFRPTMTGEAGMRNVLHGPGIFGLDSGVAKTWKLTERQALQFHWDVFNVTNSASFDSATMSASMTNTTEFGKYSSTLSDKRVMQLALRYQF